MKCVFGVYVSGLRFYETGFYGYLRLERGINGFFYTYCVGMLGV